MRKKKTRKTKSTARTPKTINEAIRSAANLVRQTARKLTGNETVARKLGRAVRGAARQTYKHNVRYSLSGVRRKARRTR